VSEKALRENPGPKFESKITDSAYSLIARGEFPSKRRYIERWLSVVSVGLIHDPGPAEKELSAAQAILIDRVILKLRILRCIEDYVREKGVMKGNDISPSVARDLACANSMRLDLLALGISEKAGDRILCALILAVEIDQESAEAKAQAREAVLRGSCQYEYGMSSQTETFVRYKPSQSSRRLLCPQVYL
jgi:hypothetical protein